MSDFILAASPQIGPNPVIMLPFAAMLICIALLPLILRHHWERNYHVVALALGTITVSYYIFALGKPGPILHEAHEYVSFITLVGSLFIVAGGIHITVSGQARPSINCLFLLCGGLLANFIGTTGASMLLIRPWIRLNKSRFTGLHTAFFIFIVSNIGGGLTPVGDPPLFLGYLKGVPFWWVLRNCWRPWSIAMGALLLIFYLIDRHNFMRTPREVREEQSALGKFRIEGLRNLPFLLLILVAVFIQHPPFVRELLMALAAGGSYLATPKSIHAANFFSFEPIKEVAWLFLGIFATMVPVLEYMSVHADKLAVNTPGQFFWMTGGLSSVLDNAPTYIALLANALGQHGLNFETAGHMQQFLAADGLELAAISMGAVLFGAATYIGNGPNFMVKAIVDQQKMQGPSFFGFIFKFSIPALLPVLFLVYWLTIRS